MKIKHRTIIDCGCIDSISMELSNGTDEENFAINFGHYSLLLVDRGVGNPFWSLRKVSSPWPITIIKGWANESIALSLAGGWTLIVDPLRVIVSMTKAYPVQYTGHHCTNCGAATVYSGSEQFDRENVNYGVDYSYQHCPFCGAGDYVPGFEPEESQDEAEKPIPEDQLISNEPLTLTEEPEE